MKHIKWLPVLALVVGFYSANAQKTVAGLKFSKCLNKKDLPAKFYKGKFLVLDFWATWCGPCIGSFPKVDALQKQYKDNPKVVFACITAQSPGLIDTFFHRKKDILPGVLHLTDKNSATWKYFDINFIPQIYVFNPSGKMVYSGTVEELAGNMDKLLKGATMLKAPEPKEPVEDKWEKYKQAAKFMAIICAPDTSKGPNWVTNFSSDRSKAKIEENNVELLDAIETAGNLTSIAIKYNDSIKAHRLMTLCYKQEENDFPEFDKGIFGYQYQNHILDLLEHFYSFKSERTTEKVTAYKIVIKDKKLLEAAATLSTGGSGDSRTAPKKYHFVNETLIRMASTAEDYLKVPVLADTVAGGYDVDLDFNSLPDFEKSLAEYGLGIEKKEGYEMKKLSLVFY